METADVSDISNSPAYQSLDELVASGKLTQAQAQLYRSKYAKLHEVVLKTYENEKNLLKKAKLLNQDLTAEKGKLEKTAARAQEDSEAIAALRAEMSKGESELSLREERELLLQQEVQDLASTRADLETEVADNTKRLAAELQPQEQPHYTYIGPAIYHPCSRRSSHTPGAFSAPGVYSTPREGVARGERTRAYAHAYAYTYAYAYA